MGVVEEEEGESIEDLSFGGREVLDASLEIEFVRKVTIDWELEGFEVLLEVVLKIKRNSLLVFLQNCLEGIQELLRESGALSEDSERLRGFVEENAPLFLLLEDSPKLGQGKLLLEKELVNVLEQVDVKYISLPLDMSGEEFKKQRSVFERSVRNL